MTRREGGYCHYTFFKLVWNKTNATCTAIFISSEEPGYRYGWSECGGPGASHSSHETSCRKTSRREWSVKENCRSRRSSIWRGVKRKQTTEGSPLVVAVFTVCCPAFITDAIQMSIRKSNRRNGGGPMQIFWTKLHSNDYFFLPSENR